jgi:hypothetical protein
MREFKYPILKETTKNKKGQKIQMVCDRNATIWIYHEDCNKDFERLNDFIYKLTTEEEHIIQTFCGKVDRKINELV